MYFTRENPTLFISERRDSICYKTCRTNQNKDLIWFCYNNWIYEDFL